MLRILKEVFGGSGGAGHIAPREAVQLMDDGAAMIDVREPAEFAAGHIASAINVPLSALRQNCALAIATAAPGISRKTILVICRSGARSAVACGLLKDSFQNNPINVQGGMLAWQACGLAVSK